MSVESAADVGKRITFISFALGLMLGVALYLSYMAFQSENYILLVTMLPLLIVSIPMIRTLVRLRKSDRVSG